LLLQPGCSENRTLAGWNRALGLHGTEGVRLRFDCYEIACVYSAADVARELGVCKITVLRWVSDGRLRQPRLYMLNSSGKAWLWDTDEFSLATAIKKIQARSKR
jgi:hypothetical protein